tara:strand:+ start:470 stop:1117 length:648 start_codon:yes stop_codon:yes gene_type:complete
MHNTVPMFSGNWDGTETPDIDGSGVTPSVTLEIADRIKTYIHETYGSTVKTIIDVGGGVGYLQSVLEKDSMYDAWTIEGFKGENMPFFAESSRLITADMTKPFSKDFENSFDLVTSFECIEHVTKEHQKKFWDNVFYFSNKALVGIHCCNEENNNHRFIRSADWWINFFIENDIEYTVLGKPVEHKSCEQSEPYSSWSVVPWTCSCYFKLENNNV